MRVSGESFCLFAQVYLILSFILPLVGFIKKIDKMHHKGSTHRSTELNKVATAGSDGNSSIGKGEREVVGRAVHVPNRLLWMDDKENPIPIRYAFERDLPADYRSSFEAQVKIYTDQTCLTFEKVELPAEDKVVEWCSFKMVKRKQDRLLYLMSREGGASPTGINSNGPRCEQLLHFPAGYRKENYFLIAGSLGLMEPFNRPDFKNYVSLNLENFEKLGDLGFLRAVFKCLGKAIALPIPFDGMSVMLMNPDWYSREGNRPVFVTMDPKQQYLLDYRHRGQLPPSFFDILTVNTLYKCATSWESSCKASGKETPKCKNYGYVTKDCTCRCAPSFSGKTCEDRTGDHLPYPTQNGAFSIKIKDDGRYDLGKLLPLKTASLPEAHPDFKYNVFVLVKIRPTKRDLLPSIRTFLPFREVGGLLVQLADKIISRIDQLDCEKAMRLLWGSINVDGHRRLACECTSVLATNEPEENSRVLRGRRPNMTITLVNNLGLDFRRELFTVETSKLVLIAEFHPAPNFKSEQSYKENNKQNNTTPIIPVGNGTAEAAAMKGVGGSNPTAVIVGVVTAALLFLLCLLLCLLKRRKQKKKEELGEEEEEAEKSGSSSESDD